MVLVIARPGVTTWTVFLPLWVREGTDKCHRGYDQKGGNERRDSSLEKDLCFRDEFLDPDPDPDPGLDSSRLLEKLANASHSFEAATQRTLERLTRHGL